MSLSGGPLGLLPTPFRAAGGTYQVRNFDHAVALGTLGARVYPDRSVVIQNESERAELVTWFYEGWNMVPGVPVPGRNDTDVRASKLYQLYKRGDVERFSPNHPFLFCLSALQNYRRLLDHLKTGASVKLWPITGSLRHELFAEPNEAPLAYPQLLVLNELAEASALLTLGFTLFPEKTECRREGGKLLPKLYFAANDEAVRLVTTGRQTNPVFEPQYLRYLHCAMAVRNRLTLRQRTNNKSRVFLISAPEQYAKQAPFAKHRLAVINETVSQTSKAYDGLKNFFTKQKR